MLLRFTAGNYLSIAERQSLSLVATKLKGPKVAQETIPSAGNLFTLPSALIYGANASGKTNFVKAFNFLRAGVLFSHTRGDPEGGVPRHPFALDRKMQSSPTFVEAEFMLNNLRFIYGFECNDRIFLSEWLYSFPEGKRRKLFERSGDRVDFGPHMRGPKKALVDFMRPNSLFVATATQNDHEGLSRIASFFRSSYFSRNIHVSEEMLNNTFKENQIDQRTISFLKEIGTGIIGYRQLDKIIPDNVKSFTREIALLARKHLGDVLVRGENSEDGEKDVSIELSHRDRDGEEHFLRLERESSGTRRLLLLMNAVFRALDQGSLLIIDELDASLHTQAAEQVLMLFQDPKINEKGAQLIATTHDTNILNCSCVRRDQVWFCEKDEAGATHLYSLSDIKSRASDNFEQGYLEGRYGAIPFAGNPKNLFRGI